MTILGTMTQTSGATRPPQLKPGVTVRHRSEPTWAGEIRQPDAFYLTLRLRGVAPRDQKLVHWPDADICTWEHVENLTAETPEETR